MEARRDRPHVHPDGSQGELRQTVDQLGWHPLMIERLQSGKGRIIGWRHDEDGRRPGVDRALARGPIRDIKNDDDQTVKDSRYQQRDDKSRPIHLDLNYEQISAYNQLT